MQKLFDTLKIFWELGKKGQTRKEDNGNNTLHLQVNVGSKMIKASRQKQEMAQ